MRDARFWLPATVAIVVLWASVVVRDRGSWAQEAAEAEPRYMLVTATLAGRGETFTGRVLENVPEDGWVPLSGGSQVVFSGEVVGETEPRPVTEEDDEAEEAPPEYAVAVGPEGVVEVPGFDQVGNRFLRWSVRTTREVRRGGLIRRVGLGDGDVERRVVQSEVFAHHVEVVPVAEGLPTEIARTTEILIPEGPLTLEGQSLALERVELEGPGGESIPLESPVGSSLQQVVRLPALERPGRYRVVAYDESGTRHESPNPSVRLELLARGDEVRHRGQEGEIVVRVNTFGSERGGAEVTLTGGPPQIRLHRHRAFARDGEDVVFPFTAEVVGQYEVSILASDPRDVPVDEEAPPVDAVPWPTETTYDPERDETTVESGIEIVDETGDPVPDTPVEVCVTHPGGVEFVETTTDADGVATAARRLPGRVPASEVSAHAYEVPGLRWDETKIGPSVFEIGDPPEPPAARPEERGPCCCIGALRFEVLQDDLTLTITDQEGHVARGSGTELDRGDERTVSADGDLGCYTRLNFEIEGPDGELTLDKSSVSCRDFPEARTIAGRPEGRLDVDGLPESELVIREVVPEAEGTRVRPRALLRVRWVVKRQPCPVPPRSRPTVLLEGPYPRDGAEWDEKNLRTGERTGRSYEGSGAIVGMVAYGEELGRAPFGCRKACWVQTVRTVIDRFRGGDRCDPANEEDLRDRRCWSEVTGDDRWRNDNPTWPRRRSIPGSDEAYPRWCYQGQSIDDEGRLLMTDGPHLRHDTAEADFPEGTLLRRRSQFQTALVCLDPEAVLERFQWQIETLFTVGGTGNTVVDPPAGAEGEWKGPEDVGMRRLPLEMPDGWNDRPRGFDHHGRGEGQ